MTWLVAYFNVGKVQELIQYDYAVAVDVKGVECRVEYVEGKVVIGLNELEVVAELFPGDLLILVLVISKVEELFDVIETDFSL